MVHDYEHGGLTNDFLINTSAPLALTYNDKAPLENHHVSAAFLLLAEPSCNFLDKLSKPVSANWEHPVFVHMLDNTASY
jgi:3'5'-cyclic nucleotide phosphodiesterase